MSPFTVQPVFLFLASLQDLPLPPPYYRFPNGSGKHIPHFFLGLRPMKWWQLFKNAGCVCVCMCVCVHAWSRAGVGEVVESPKWTQFLGLLGELVAEAKKGQHVASLP